MKRIEIIDAIVEDLLDSAMNDADFLHSIIRNGFKGIEEMSNEELLDQWEMQFGDIRETPTIEENEVTK